MQLTDTQLMMLSQASQREDHALVLPERLKGGAAQKVVRKLLDHALVQEVPAGGKLPVCRQDDVEGSLALIITEAGLVAIGLEKAEDEPQDEEVAAAAPTAGEVGVAMPEAPARRRRSRSSTARAASSNGADSTEARKQGQESNPARPSKQETVIGLLRRPDGASVPEIMQATGWQAHSVRGFLAGTVKKKLGLSLVAEKGRGGERRYHIAALAEAAA